MRTAVDERDSKTKKSRDEEGGEKKHREDRGERRHREDGERRRHDDREEKKHRDGKDDRERRHRDNTDGRSRHRDDGSRNHHRDERRHEDGGDGRDRERRHRGETDRDKDHGRSSKHRSEVQCLLSTVFAAFCYQLMHAYVYSFDVMLYDDTRSYFSHINCISKTFAVMLDH